MTARPRPRYVNRGSSAVPDVAALDLPNRPGLRNDQRSRALPRRLQEGQHSVDWAQPSIGVVNRRMVKTLRWKVRPYGYARSQTYRTQVPLGTSDEALRARARQKAEAMLRHEANGRWSRGSQFSEYVTAVVLPKIENDPTLTKGSIRQYRRSLGLLMGVCNKAGCVPHRASLAPFTLFNSAQYRQAVNCLEEISRLHGAGAAKHARCVLTGYVYKQFEYDNFIETGPLVGKHVDLTTMAAKNTRARKGGLALSPVDYQRVLRWLLDYQPQQDPAALAAPPWRRTAVESKLIRVRDLTVVQMATGLRIHEALNITVDKVKINPDGRVTLDVLGKNKHRRMASSWAELALPVFRRLTEGVAPDNYLIGSPNDGAKEWEARNATRAVAELYLRLSGELKIPILHAERSHLWRATLNTLTSGVLSLEKRAIQFGHSTKVNLANYTDFSLTDEELRAAYSVLQMDSG